MFVVNHKVQIMLYKFKLVLALLACFLIKIQNAAEVTKVARDSGRWKEHYTSHFPFSINGRSFFYAQGTIDDGHNWFIQELLADGDMGEETDHGLWKEHYDVAFPFSIEGRHFFMHKPQRLMDAIGSFKNCYPVEKWAKKLIMVLGSNLIL